jgi:hydrogenase 3 maturation protease
MRGDDGLGSILCRLLDENWENDAFVSIDGGTVPENFTGVIKRENPSHILLVDAVNMNQVPGHIKLVKKDEISKYSISTHALPISFIIKYLEEVTDSKIALLGVQPKNMDLEEEMSDEVKKSIDKVINILNNLFHQ